MRRSTLLPQCVVLAAWLVGGTVGGALSAQAGQAELNAPVLRNGDKHHVQPREGDAQSPRRTADSPRRTTGIPRRDRWSFGMRLFLPGEASIGVSGATGRGDIGCSSSPAGHCDTPSSGLLPASSSNPLESRGRIPGLTVDAGMTIARRFEVGLGVDVSTPLGASNQSRSSSHGGHTAELTDASAAHGRGVQLDVAGRVRFLGSEQTLGDGPGVTPYFGFGGGLSHYATLATSGGPDTGHVRTMSSPPTTHLAAYGWTPNLQISTGALFKSGGIPLIDLEARYVWLATNTIGASGIRIGAGLRYGF